MYLQNAGANVPSNIRAVFDSYVPFGSDFVYYCYDNGYNVAKYAAVFRKAGSSDVSCVTAERNSDGSYTFTESTLSGDFSTISVARPEYAYSNLTGVGQYYELPSGNTLMIVCVVVLASLAVLRTVFGGIRWTLSRKYRV